MIGARVRGTTLSPAGGLSRLLGSVFRWVVDSRGFGPPVWVWFIALLTGSAMVWYGWSVIEPGHERLHREADEIRGWEPRPQHTQPEEVHEEDVEHDSPEDSSGSGPEGRQDTV